nr:hypothetical protein [Evansella caseinilytica]
MDSHRSCACRGRDKHKAMSHSSLRHCELSHRVIARAGTWTDVGALLVEEETIGGAAVFFSSRL